MTDTNNKATELFKQVGLDWPLVRDHYEHGYDYLINDYIPKQGHADMIAFIDLGFSPFNYLLWKLEVNGLLKESLAEGLRERIKEVFDKYPEGGIVNGT